MAEARPPGEHEKEEEEVHENIAMDTTRSLTEADKEKLDRQEARKVSDYRAEKYRAETAKHWDKFYKRNGNRFFKDRHWTRREFEELCALRSDFFTLLEVGCGAGNFIFPLIEECGESMLKAYVCDFSPRAIEMIKENPLYDERKVYAFWADVAKAPLLQEDRLPEKVDLVSAIFVLSAISPSKFHIVLKNMSSTLKVR